MLQAQAFNGIWPTSPPLDPAEYTGSFGAILSGYVLVSKNRDLVDLTVDHPALYYYNRFRCGGGGNRAMGRLLRPPAGSPTSGACRVCMQFTGGWAMLRIGDKSLISAVINIAGQTRLKVTDAGVAHNVYLADADLDPEALPHSGSTRV